MNNDDKGLIRTVITVVLNYILHFASGVAIIVVIIDESTTDGSNLVQPVLSFAKENEAALTVILSGLLLFAYLMQYQNQRIQRNIMDRQVKLMRAGYTPILGVSNRKWGAEKVETGEDQDQKQANRLFLDLSNTGNSTAQDLRLWTALWYEPTDELNHHYRPKTTPLRRTSDPSWWHSDEGGALAQKEDSTTEFKADPKINKTNCTWYNINQEEDPIYLHAALEELEEAGVVDVEIVFILKYTATTGAEEEIHLGAYEANLPGLKSDNMRVYRSQENKEERVENIKQGVNNIKTRRIKKKLEQVVQDHVIKYHDKD